MWARLSCTVQPGRSVGSFHSRSSSSAPSAEVDRQMASSLSIVSVGIMAAFVVLPSRRSRSSSHRPILALASGAMQRPSRFEHTRFLGDKRTQLVYDLDALG